MSPEWKRLLAALWVLVLLLAAVAGLGAIYLLRQVLTPPPPRLDWGNFPPPPGGYGNFPRMPSDFGNFPPPPGGYGNFPRMPGMR